MENVMEADNYLAIDEQIKALQARKARILRENAMNFPNDVGLVWMPDMLQHLSIGLATNLSETAWLHCRKCDVIHHTVRSDEQRSRKYYETKAGCPNCGL